MRTWVEPFRAELVGRGRRPRGVASYVASVEQLLAWLGGREAAVVPCQISAAALARWRNQRASRCAPATVHAELCAVRAFCRYLLSVEVLADDPTARLVFPRPRPRAPRPLPRAEVQAMLAALEISRRPGEHAHTAARARLGVLLFLYSGLRLSEVAALRWADVDLAGRSLVVRDGKGGKARAVPIHRVLAAELAASDPGDGERAVIGDRQGRVMHPKSVAEIFTRWLAARGVMVTAHRLRHTFATTMLRSGAPLRDIQAALGHSSLETTEMYLLCDASHLQEAVDRLPDSWA